MVKYSLQLVDESYFCVTIRIVLDLKPKRRISMFDDVSPLSKAK